MQTITETPAARASLVSMILDGSGPVYRTSGRGYESSAGCKMQATHCAYCARPLTDAESVQRGVGPDCAARHDVASARTETRPAELAAACRLAAAALPVELAGLEERIARELAAHGPRRAANVLVYLIALVQVGPAVAYMVSALGALGYGAQAERIGERLGHVKVTHEGENLVARLPFDAALIQIVSAIPGRRIERRRDAGKRREYVVNIIPVTRRAALWSALRTRLPAGTLVLGTEGYRVIPAAR